MPLAPIIVFVLLLLLVLYLVQQISMTPQARNIAYIAILVVSVLVALRFFGLI